MNEAKVRALKRQVQEAAVDAARKYLELGREETGRACCGQCPDCQESLANLAKLFFKAMEREVVALFAEEVARSERTSRRQPDDGFIAKDRLN